MSDASIQSVAAIEVILSVRSIVLTRRVYLVIDVVLRMSVIRSRSAAFAPTSFDPLSTTICFHSSSEALWELWLLLAADDPLDPPSDSSLEGLEGLDGSTGVGMGRLSRCDLALVPFSVLELIEPFLAVSLPVCVAGTSSLEPARASSISMSERSTRALSGGMPFRDAPPCAERSLVRDFAGVAL